MLGGGVDEEVDADLAFLDKAVKRAGICGRRGCKTSVKLMGVNCRSCKLRFCFSHHLPEEHVCVGIADVGVGGRTIVGGVIGGGRGGGGGEKRRGVASDGRPRDYVQRDLAKKIQDKAGERTSKQSAAAAEKQSKGKGKKKKKKPKKK